MHIDYKVRLPDHNFVVGDRHKLIPSAYGVCNILPNGKVSYSGNTFIRLRSGKHDSSTAYTHAYDLNELFQENLIPNTLTDIYFRTGRFSLRHFDFFQHLPIGIKKQMIPHLKAPIKSV